MADHVITLNNKQENAAQSIVDGINKPVDVGSPAGTLTVDEWMRKLVIQPIKQRIDELDALKMQAISTALPNATNDQLNQIKAILGIG